MIFVRIYNGYSLTPSRLYGFGRTLPNLDELERDGHSDYYRRISSRARGLWSLKNKTSETFVFYILAFQRKFTNWTTMLLERPKDEVALLSVFLLLRIPLFEPVSFEIVPGEYANRLASTYRSNSTCRSSHGNRQGRAFLCFALRRATCPPRSLSSMRRTRFPAIKMHVRSSIHDHNYVLREHRAERGLYLHTCDTVRARWCFIFAHLIFFFFRNRDDSTLDESRDFGFTNICATNMTTGNFALRRFTTANRVSYSHKKKRNANIYDQYLVAFFGERADARMRFPKVIESSGTKGPRW